MQHPESNAFGERTNRQRGVCGQGAGNHGAVGNIEIIVVPNLAAMIDHACLRAVTHDATPEWMSREEPARCCLQPQRFAEVCARTLRDVPQDCLHLLHPIGIFRCIPGQIEGTAAERQHSIPRVHAHDQKRQQVIRGPQQARSTQAGR